MPVGDWPYDQFKSTGWMLEPDTSSSCGGFASYLMMFEVGWREGAFDLDSNGNPRQRVHWLRANDCWGGFLSGVDLESGEVLRFVIEPASLQTCGDGGNYNCTRRAKVLRLGVWITVAEAYLPAGNDMRPNVASYIDNSDSGTHWEQAGAAADYDVDYSNVEVKTASGTWVDWVSGAPTGSFLSDTSAYCIQYFSNYYRFETRKC